MGWMHRLRRDRGLRYFFATLALVWICLAITRVWTQSDAPTQVRWSLAQQDLEGVTGLRLVVGGDEYRGRSKVVVVADPRLSLGISTTRWRGRRDHAPSPLVPKAWRDGSMLVVQIDEPSPSESSRRRYRASASLHDVRVPAHWMALHADNAIVTVEQPIRELRVQGRDLDVRGAVETLHAQLNPSPRCNSEEDAASTAGGAPQRRCGCRDSATLDVEASMMRAVHVHATDGEVRLGHVSPSTRLYLALADAVGLKVDRVDALQRARWSSPAATPAAAQATCAQKTFATVEPAGGPLLPWTQMPEPYSSD